MGFKFRTAALVALLANAPAFAHAYLTSPAGRSTTAIKAFPCGVNTAGASKRTYQPGEVATVTFTESVGHPGYFILDFGRSIDNTFDGGFSALYQPDGGSLTNINNPTGTNATLSAVVKMPTAPCPLCQLRLRQFMSEPGRAADPWYFSCADITIAPGTTDAGQPTKDAGTVTQDAGPITVDAGNPDPGTETDAGNPDPNPDPVVDHDAGNTNPGNNNPGNNDPSADAGGCSSTGGSLLAVLGLLSLAATRLGRRRRES